MDALTGHLALLVTLPAAAGAAVLALGRLGKRDLLGAGVLAAMTVAFVIDSGSIFAGTDSWRRIGSLVAALMALALVTPRTLPPGASFLVVGLLACLWISPPGLSFAARLSAGVAAATTAWLISRQRAKRPDAALPVSLGVPFAAMVWLFVESGFPAMAVVSGAGALACLIGAVIGKANSERPAAALGVVAGVLATLVQLGIAYDQGGVPVMSWIIIAASPLALVALDGPLGRISSKAVRVLTSIAGCAAVAALAIGLLLFMRPEPSRSSPAGDPLDGIYGPSSAPAAR